MDKKMINIDELIKDALKNQDKVRLNVYRAIKTKITEFKSAKNAKEYTEAVELQLLDKMKRERLDSAKQYQEGGRQELADMEIYESDVISKLLPSIPTNVDVQKQVIEVCEELNFVNVVDKTIQGQALKELLPEIPKKEMGKVIKLVKEKLPLADGKLVSDIVKSYLV